LHLVPTKGVALEPTQAIFYNRISDE
jgi:hypothetical protein